MLLPLRTIALYLWIKINETPPGLKYYEEVSVVRQQVPYMLFSGITLQIDVKFNIFIKYAGYKKNCTLYIDENSQLYCNRIVNTN